MSSLLKANRMVAGCGSSLLPVFVSLSFLAAHAEIQVAGSQRAKQELEENISTSPVTTSPAATKVAAATGETTAVATAE